MDIAPKAPKPLTEAQRNEVRTLLKQLSAASASRRSKRNPNENPLSRKKIKKVKHIENPFESIEEGQTVGMDELSPDCCTLTFVQRTRIVLLPYIYDNLYQTYKEWAEMIVHYCGCLKSSLDEGVKEHIKFVVEGNAPIRYLHLYLESDPDDKTLFKVANFMFAT